ncbi:MAG: exosortase [Acidobacteria bacterium]|nr:exosortase [Acidobacteriota bacterium]
MSASSESAPQPAASWRILPWPMLVWFALLLTACHLPVLVRLVRQWSRDEDMGHGFFVPLVVAYIIWQKREQWLALTPAPSWWGLAVVIGAALQSYLANLGAELFLARTAFVISLIGMVLFLGGWAYLRVLAFPLALLFLMVPIPAIIYNQITLPLQFLASQLAAAALSLMGIPVLREGNILELPSQSLSVVEACSGIRSLLSLTFLALVYGFLFEPQRIGMRITLLLATVPIAIAANASRVTITGLLSEYKSEWAEGFFHLAEGWVIFMAALAALVAFHQLLNLVTRGRHARA